MKWKSKFLKNPRGDSRTCRSEVSTCQVTEKVDLAHQVCEFFGKLIDHMKLEDITIESSFADGTLELEIFGDEVGASLEGAVLLS